MPEINCRCLHAARVLLPASQNARLAEAALPERICKGV